MKIVICGAGEFDVKPGDQVWVQIIHADEHDVWGVKVEDEE